MVFVMMEIFLLLWKLRLISILQGFLREIPISLTVNWLINYTNLNLANKETVLGMLHVFFTLLYYSGNFKLLFTHCKHQKP